MSRFLVLTAAVLLAAPAGAGSFTAAEMMRLKRLSDPQISPDGKWVLYGVTDIVDAATNARNADLWLVPLAGGEPRRLTSHPKSDSRGRFSPDGRRVAFVSARDGAPQVFLLDLAGGEAQKVTTLAGGVNGFSWLDAQSLLLAADVAPDCGTPGSYDDDCNRKKLDAAAQAPSPRVYEALLFRHWDTWEDGRRSHLLVAGLDGKVHRDLTPGDRDVPPFGLGGADDFAVSPDGREVAFVRNDDPVPAISTNAELYVVPSAGGEPKKVAGSPGYDGSPRYSADGTQLAFRAQMRAGYESDRWRLMVYDRRTGVVRNRTEDFDRHVESFSWSADGRMLYVTASEAAQEPLYALPPVEGPVRKIAEGSFGDVQAAPDGKTLVMTGVSLAHPAEIYRFEIGRRAMVGRIPTRLANLSRANDAFLATFALKPGESVTYQGAAGKPVQAWIVKPADFDATRKYPLLVLIHGGPQGVWGDAWSFRWNAQVFANAGYVVFMPNPRGSVGWGQEFVDDINADWGGRAYEDVIKGTDFAEALPYVDRTRTAAAGASYGGYLVNWIAGHTDRYRALVSHDGVYDLVSMYGATEELWFVDWEFKGPYWQSPDVYARWTPSAHAARFRTPTLVIHGELDHRVPLEQGLGLFTALQRRGVPSRLVLFPDENHWVLKPANSLRWYQEVISWLDRWVKS